MPTRAARALAAALAVAAAAAPAATARAAERDPVRAAIDRAASAAAIAPEAADAYRAAYEEALTARRPLRGLRRRELSAAIRIARGIAARGSLTVSRMPAVFLTLRRNAQWWREQGPPAAGSPGEPDVRGRRCRPFARASRVRFPGSDLVFQYYPGMGLQLHLNASFALAAAYLREVGPEADAALARLVDELIAVRSIRGGATVWEYEFPFGGARPPWTSALSQGSAIRVLALASRRLGRPDWMEVARAGVGAFAARPPVGLNVRLERDGSWYALYGFAPGLRVLNAHLNALVGLYDYWRVSGDPDALHLYREGLRAARRRIAGFDTGRWSRYANPGREADLNYHVLNRDLARAVCVRSKEEAICRAERRFTAYLERRCPRVPGAARRP